MRRLAAALAHVAANPGHSYYFSLWHRITRVYGETSGTNTPYLVGVTMDPAPNGTCFHAIRSTITRPNTAPAFVGARCTTGTDNTCPTLRNIAHAAKTGSGTDPLSASLARFGQYTFGTVTKLPSWVFYRAYLEGLTISGRSYTAVDALDNALYTQEVLTSGGRYNGDAFTNPATIA